MREFLNKFKIPTLLGLGIIFLGIGSGVFLTLREQTFISQADVDVTAQNVTITNVTDSSAVVSYHTPQEVTSFVTFVGPNSPSEQTRRNDKDKGALTARTSHYVTLTNLLPNTTYQLKIVTGKNTSELHNFTTASPTSAQTNFSPVVGTVLVNDQPLKEGVVYLTISGAINQSAQVKDLGNFLIPLSQIRKGDRSDIFPLTEDTIAKLTVVSNQGEASALFKLKQSGISLPSLKLGQNLDLTETGPIATPSPEELQVFDLNSDGEINAADMVIILRNFGRNPRQKEADINSDKVVDEKDLQVLSDKINEQFNQ